MARILFGVMGDALGHVNRALAVAQEMPQHEFLFLGGGKTLNLRKKGCHVEEVAMPSTYYSKNKVDVLATVQNGIKVLVGRKRTIERVEEITKDFDPDLVLTDYEIFSSLSAQRLRIPCISVDNQHFLTKCVYSLPGQQIMSRLMYYFSLRCMFSNAERYIITTFFEFPPKDPVNTEVFPPILRRGIKEFAPKEGDHVLIYQTSPTFYRLLPVLEQMPNRCIVYGFGERPPSKNLVYKGYSPQGFLEDLASCRYIITNGGHNAISEALFLGKPIFSFPIHLAYEQFFNAQMVKSLGFGDYSLALNPALSLFEAFEKLLDGFRARIAEGDFFGNEKLAARLERIIQNQRKW